VLKDNLLKYIKPINIWNELGICGLYWLISILYLGPSITEDPLTTKYRFEVIRYVVIILCLVLIASITIRGIRKYPERIIFSNFLFGLIVGTIEFILIGFGFWSADSIIIKMSVLTFFSLSLMKGLIAGVLAVLWGWAIVTVITVFKKQKNELS